MLEDEDTVCNCSLLIWLVPSLFDVWYSQICYGQYQRFLTLVVLVKHTLICLFFSKLRNVMSYLVMETPGDIWHMAVKYWHIFACIYNDVTRAIFFCILFKEAILGWAGCQAKVSVFWAVYKTQQSTSSYFAPLINHNCQDSGKSGAFAHSNAWQECSLVEQIEKCMTQRSRVFGQMNCVKWHPH